MDPILGAVSGLWAYYLYESRLQRPEGHSLPQLISRKWEQRKLKNQLNNKVNSLSIQSQPLKLIPHLLVGD